MAGRRILANSRHELLWGVLSAVALLLVVVWPEPLVAVAIGLMLVAVVLPLRRRLQKWFDYHVFRIRYQPQEVLRAYSPRISSVRSRRTLRQLVVDDLLPTLGIRQSAVYLLGESKPIVFARRGLSTAAEELAPEDVRWLLESAGEYLLTTHPTVPWVRLSVPLRVHDELVGLWLFGSREPDDVLPASDIQVLVSLGILLASALENLRLLETTRRDADLTAKLNAVLLQEVEERKRVQWALGESERRFRALYDDSPVMLITTDDQGRILTLNWAAIDELGYSETELIGRPISYFSPEVTKPVMEEQVRECLAAPLSPRRWEVPVTRRDGSSMWVRVAARVIADTETLVNVLLVLEDTTQSRELSERLSYQATHDSLTGLLNRLEFERRLQQLVDDAHSQGGEHALCYMDLDQFKVINDTCGHIAGDEVLRQISAQLLQALRKRDSLARLGGDEFGVLVRDCAAADAGKVAEMLRRTVEEHHFTWEDRTFDLSASIGVAPIDSLVESAPGILSAADAACYSAKDSGRNRIRISRVDDVELVRRHGEMEWVARLNRALEEDRFLLVFQPIVPVDPDRPSIRFCELLLRMEDEAGVTISPGAFLPAAERYLLAAKLDRWVIGRGCQWMAQRRAAGDPPMMCSFNLSGHTLDDGDFPGFAGECLNSHGVPPELVCFEIAETVAIRNLTRAGELIRELKELGCRVALDDFGSGLSSFAYLRNLQVDLLKIDGLFVRHLLGNEINRAIVGAICEIGRVMGKETVAEWVEEPEVLTTIRELGIDYAQGYGIAAPRPIEEHRDEIQDQTATGS